MKGDFVFCEWKENGWKNFRKKVSELRESGYRKINQDHDYLNYCEVYRRRGNKHSIVTVTMMCC